MSPVPKLRAFMSLHGQYRIPLLCITTVITFGALNNLSPGVLYSGGGDRQRTPVVKSVTSLEFGGAYHLSGIL